MDRAKSTDPQGQRHKGLGCPGWPGASFCPEPHRKEDKETTEFGVSGKIRQNLATRNNISDPEILFSEM